MINLLPHNVDTYEHMENMLNSTKRCAVTQATGTGKSYLSLKYIEQMNFNSILIVVPTNLLGDYWKEKEYLVNRNFTVVTYQLLSLMDDRNLKQFLNTKFDFVILDELHRVGAEQWGCAITKLLNEWKSIPVLGLTATPIRSLDNNRNIAEEVFETNIVEGLSLQQAIISEVLPNFTYVSAIYNVSERIQEIKSSDTYKLHSRNKEFSRLLDKIDYDLTSVSKMKEILAKHLSKNEKLILFASDMQEKEQLEEILSSWFSDYKSYDLDYTMTSSECRKVISEFNLASEGVHVLKTINKLNEGVHVEDVTGLIMLRRTESNIIFFQQLGRALSAANKNRKIVVFDFVNNFREIKSSSATMDFIGFLNGHKKSKGSFIVVDDYTQEVLDVVDMVLANLSNSWTQEEDEILKKYYPVEGIQCAKRLPDRTKLAVKGRIHVLGLSHDTSWTQEEDEILKKYYPTEGLSVSSRLKNRTISSIRNRVTTLNISFIKSDSWTDEEISIIKEFYPTEGYATYKRLPNRTKFAVAKQAELLGIKKLNLNKRWTQEEDEILKKYYPTEGPKVVLRLNGRTEEAVKSRASAKKIRLLKEG